MLKQSKTDDQYELVDVHQEKIFAKMRKNGCRITSQRRLILDIILKNKYSCCKEIYYEAAAKDPSIGIATVYRMMNMLEDMQIISRRNMYQLQLDDGEKLEDGQMILVEGENKVKITDDELFQNLRRYLKKTGYIKNDGFSVIIKKIDIEKECSNGLIC